MTKLDPHTFENLAAFYESIPDDTIIDMSKCAFCAAGKLGEIIKGGENAFVKLIGGFQGNPGVYERGIQALDRIIGINQPGTMSKTIEGTLLQLLDYGIGNPYGNNDPAGSTLSFYRGATSDYTKTTTGELARFWRQVAQVIRDPNTPIPFVRATEEL